MLSPVSFTRYILPILSSMVGLQWVNAGYAAVFGWRGPQEFLRADYLARLSSKAAEQAELRRTVCNACRNFERDGFSPTPWPWLYGDAMDVPPVKTPRQHAALSSTQLRMLELWAEGKFDADYDPLAAAPDNIEKVALSRQPETLDQAALAFCLADAFHPGCELTWPMRHASLYRAPFRIRARAAADVERRENREGCRHERPEPSVQPPLLVGRFVDAHPAFADNRPSKSSYAGRKAAVA